MLVVVSIYELLGTITFLFAPCELGERICSEYDDINNLVSQYDWHLFPHEIQRLLPMIMANAQEEVGVKWFGSYLCNRLTFKVVGHILFARQIHRLFKS